MRSDYFLHVLDEIRLNHVERVEARCADSFEIHIPMERRTESCEFLSAQLVINLLWIAAAGLVERTLGQAGFNIHDDFSFSRCRRFVVAKERKHLRHMLDIFLAE